VAALLDSDKAAMATVAQPVAIARMELCFPGGQEDSYGRGGPSEGGSYASSRRRLALLLALVRHKRIRKISTTSQDGRI
jgi:hypothetical protein